MTSQYTPLSEETLHAPADLYRNILKASASFFRGLEAIPRKEPRASRSWAS
jgi:hypothetical protein